MPPYTEPMPDRSQERTLRADAVVVGSGVAGLSTALAMGGLHTVLATKGTLHSSGSTALAQGGVAAALGKEDSPRLHARDTRRAGAGVAHPRRVDLLTHEGPRRVQELLRLGAHFDTQSDGALARAREAMHSAARILHAGGDRTGRELLKVLSGAAEALPQLSVEEHTRIHELIVEDGRVRGVRGVDGSGTPITVRADAVILAAGGPGRLFLRTTNPPDITGDGVAMASRAGAALADLEFVQFHPTALAAGHYDPLPLVSEAVRGEGARLVDGNGRRIMAGRHPRMELAPRDVVARAIGLERASGRSVYLDAREAPGNAFPTRFPEIHARCRDAGIDPARDLIPVTPAEHFHMGGVATDDVGRTSLPGLWACGEVAATGVHGANRLASNSLLEGLVFGRRAGRDVLRSLGSGTIPPGAPLHPTELELPAPASGGAHLPEPRPTPSPSDFRSLMDEHVGLVRDAEGLRRAKAVLASHGPETAPVDASEADAALVGWLVASAALLREESRGAHYRRDHPMPQSGWARRLVVRVGSEGQGNPAAAGAALGSTWSGAGITAERR